MRLRAPGPGPSSATNLRALACDYDGTLATGGVVSDTTLSALARLQEAGWRLIVVTGRMLDDLRSVFPGLDGCDRAVVENGAVLVRPTRGEVVRLADLPVDGLVEVLRRRRIAPLSVGQSIVATHRSQADAVAAALEVARLPVSMVFNRDSLMLLPTGVDKASGLRAALHELQIAPSECVGVGDAENDVALLEACGVSVAVANAVPQLKSRADVITAAAAGDGVVELISRLLA